MLLKKLSIIHKYKYKYVLIIAIKIEYQVLSIHGSLREDLRFDWEIEVWCVRYIMSTDTDHHLSIRHVPHCIFANCLPIVSLVFQVPHHVF